MTRRKKIVHYYFIYPLAITLSLLSLAIGLASFFLLNVHNYQSTIKNMLSNATGYNVNFSGIHGSFNLRFQPTVKIENIDISDKNNHHSFVHINNLNLSASYRSFSLGKIALSQIQLDGIDLTLSYDKNYDLILNGEILTNLKSKSKSSFDAERFLLDLHEFDVSNLNMVFINQMYDLNPIRLKNTTFNFINNYGNRHSLLIKSTIGKSEFNSKLIFQGKSIKDISQWSAGDLVISDQDSANNNIYLKANISKGNLELLDLKFNSNMRQFFVFNNTIKGKGDLLGDIHVSRISKNDYKLEGKDLTINTPNGSILNHSLLTGRYTLDKGGEIHLSKVDLGGVSSLKIYQFSDKVNLGGYFESLNFSWNGVLLHPINMLLQGDFKDVSINSSESTIPSVNNINGDFVVSKESGSVNLSLQNSELVYPWQYNKPIFINKIGSIINWVAESNSGVVLNWQNSSLQTKDFSLNTSGDYYLESGILNLSAKIDKLKVVDAPNYIPKRNIAVANFIKSAMPTGILTNLTLSINGEASKIPFINGGGTLNYSESFSDITLKFSKTWGDVSHINGDLTAVNQKIKVDIVSAKLNNFGVSNTSYVVPDFMADYPVINMSGFGSGQTADFIDYLKTTPLSSNLKYQPKMLYGKSEVSIKLDLPIMTPEKLKLSGKWKVISNDIDFGTEVPYIDNLNGVLNFTNDGVSKSKLSAQMLGSNIEVNILDKKHYQVFSPNLDYGALGDFAGFHNNIIMGRASTVLNYDLINSNISIDSDLNGVKFNAPEPLGKKESEIKQLRLNFDQNNNKLNLSYSDRLFAILNFNNSMKFQSLKVGLGTKELHIKYNNNFPITINARLKNLYITKWLDFFKELPSAKGSNKTNYPMQLELHTDALWLGGYNIDGGSIDASFNNKVVAQINMPDIYGDLVYQKNKLWVNLDKLILSSSNLVDNNKVAKVQKSQSSLPDIFIKIKNLYLQNHYVGELGASILQRNNTIYIENASVDNFASQTSFRLIDHDVSKPKEYTELRLRSQIKDYGKTISKLNIGDNLKGGDGVFDLGLKWRGGITDFGVKKTLGYATLNIKNGEFSHINPGIFGTLLGVVSLNSITNMGNLNLNTFFGKGFVFNSWDMKVDIIFDKLRVENLKLVSNSASISSFGTVSLKDDTVDSYLTVEPRLGTAVATTAGVVTLNPIIGGIVYVGEALIGNPINKALGLSYHITGKVTNPTITKFDFSEQIQNNFLSSTNIISHPASIFDVEVNK